MIGWIILGVVLALLLLLLLMPLRVCFAFGESISLWLKIGPKTIVLIPKAKKERPIPAEETPPAEEKPTKAKKQRPKPTKDEVFDLLHAVWKGVKRLLKRMGKHLTIDPVECYATIGGPDPAQVAELFGYANTAMWTVLPYLQETTNMPRPEVHVRMDFDAPGITAEGKLGIKFTLFGVLRISLGLAWPVLKWLLKFLRAAKKRERVAAKAAPQTAANAPAQQATN